MLKQKVGYGIDQRKIIKRIAKYPVVSFDIFDTIIKRDCSKPKQVFDMMERKLASINTSFRGFAYNRVKAEQEARDKSIREEITLDDIYAELRLHYFEEEIKILQKEEIEFEKAVCHRSRHMEQVYEYCIQSKKRIVFISDMYLPLTVVKEIMESAGLKNYEKIYLSCECFATKQKGSLYDYVIKDLGISSREIIHIGDNFRSDVIEARKHGISSISIKKIVYSNMIYNPNKIIEKEHVDEYRSIVSFIDNHISREMSYFRQAGYEMEGPLLMGFSKWLKEKLEENEIKKVFFLSRDGQIMKKAYDKIYDGQLESQYMYASRRALIVPTLWMCNSLEEMVSSMFFPRIGTVEAFICKMGLEIKDCEEIVRKYNLNLDKKYVYKELFREESFQNFYDEIKADIHNNSKKEYMLLIKYLKQIDFSGRVAIIDIGWHGNMQKALTKICKMEAISADIFGFYIGLNPNVINLSQQIRACGYLFESGSNERYFELQRNFTSIFETMFTANHGSVKKFAYDKGVIVPVFEPFEYEKDGSKEDFGVIQDIQEGALDFIKDVIADPGFYIEWSSAAVFQNMLLLGNAPDYQSSCMFGNIKMLGDKVTYIAKPRDRILYVLHPGKIKLDIGNNLWKIGFFRRLCRVGLPYFEVYMMLRRIYLRMCRKINKR